MLLADPARSRRSRWTRRCGPRAGVAGGDQRPRHQRPPQDDSRVLAGQSARAAPAQQERRDHDVVPRPATDREARARSRSGRALDPLEHERREAHRRHAGDGIRGGPLVSVGADPGGGEPREPARDLAPRRREVGDRRVPVPLAGERQALVSFQIAVSEMQPHVEEEIAAGGAPELRQRVAPARLEMEPAEGGDHVRTAIGDRQRLCTIRNQKLRIRMQLAACLDQRLGRIDSRVSQPRVEVSPDGREPARATAHVEHALGASRELGEEPLLGGVQLIRPATMARVVIDQIGMLDPARRAQRDSR